MLFCNEVGETWLWGRRIGLALRFPNVPIFVGVGVVDHVVDKGADGGDRACRLLFFRLCDRFFDDVSRCCDGERRTADDLSFFQRGLVGGDLVGGFCDDIGRS
jgi:hypothetical protein